MFDKLKNKATAGFIQSFNYICANTFIKGDLTCETDLRVDGKILGNITCRAKLVIGIDGFVEGEIRANSAIVEGSVLGNMQVEESLTLCGTANVEGNISTRQFTAKEGSNMNGQLTMSQNAQPPLQLITEKIQVES